MDWNPPAWEETSEGPHLEAMTRRLAECPAEFLGEPDGDVHVPAVVSDLLSDCGGVPLTAAEAAALSSSDEKGRRNRLRCILVACWLLHDPTFREQGRTLRPFLLRGLDEVAAYVKADQMVGDPDRREELARTALRAIGLRPAGEAVAVAQDRLQTLSSAERARVVREARAAEERARRIREELRRKAEEEAAAMYGRE
jgi:hypothetical protein